MTELPRDLPALVDQLRDLALVAVGLGVLGVQRAQVERRALERKLVTVAAQPRVRCPAVLRR